MATSPAPRLSGWYCRPSELRKRQRMARLSPPCPVYDTCTCLLPSAAVGCFCLRPAPSFALSATGESGKVYVADADDDAGKVSLDSEGMKSGKGDGNQFLNVNCSLENLKRYGIAGVLSYGLLNTFYYLTTFLFVWFYYAPAPGRMGFCRAVERLLKIIALVWAGSQVTKIARVGGALALAPFVDKALNQFAIRFKFQSRGKAFAAIAGACVVLAVTLFVGLTVLWA